MSFPAWLGHSPSLDPQYSGLSLSGSLLGFGPFSGDETHVKRRVLVVFAQCQVVRSVPDGHGGLV